MITDCPRLAVEFMGKVQLYQNL